MTFYEVVTKDNLGGTLKLGRLFSGVLDVNTDNQTIVVDSNGVLSVNPDSNYLVFNTIGEQQFWEISHNFGRKPIVQVFDMSGTQVWSQINHLNNDQVMISNDKPRAGYALISI